MAAWKYIKGSAEDFTGAPEWCVQVVQDNQTGDKGFEENIAGNQKIGDRIWWPSESEEKEAYTLCASDINSLYGITIIAQRERVTSINDDRLAQCIDNVNHPKHYTRGGIECIDAIKAATVGKSGIEAVCVANVVKYLWRYEEKNGVEDVKKARWYLERLISELERGE